MVSDSAVLLFESYLHDNVCVRLNAECLKNFI